MIQRHRTVVALAAVGLLLGLTVCGQALADATAPEAPNGALTGKAMGRAGFAYLTGLRQFGAVLLWNRLDPQMHEYYGGHGLGKMVFMLPNVKVITMLDPQFVEAYYVAPEILIDSGNEPGISAKEKARRLKVGLDLAREGVTNNPKSGILLASYAQLLWTDGKDLPGALKLAKRGMADDIVWRWDDEEWESMAVFEAVFKKSGETALARQAQAVRDALDAKPVKNYRPQDTD